MRQTSAGQGAWHVGQREVVRLSNSSARAKVGGVSFVGTMVSTKVHIWNPLARQPTQLMLMLATPSIKAETIKRTNWLAKETRARSATIVPQLIPEMTPPNRAKIGAKPAMFGPSAAQIMVSTVGASRMPKKSGQLVLAGAGVGGGVASGGAGVSGFIGIEVMNGCVSPSVSELWDYDSIPPYTRYPTAGELCGNIPATIGASSKVKNKGQFILPEAGVGGGWGGPGSGASGVVGFIILALSSHRRRCWDRVRRHDRTNVPGAQINHLGVELAREFLAVRAGGAR